MGQIFGRLMDRGVQWKFGDFVSAYNKSKSQKKRKRDFARLGEEAWQAKEEERQAAKQMRSGAGQQKTFESFRQAFERAFGVVYS